MEMVFEDDNDPKHTVKVAELWFNKNALWSRSGLTSLQPPHAV